MISSNDIVLTPATTYNSKDDTKKTWISNNETLWLINTQAEFDKMEEERKMVNHPALKSHEELKAEAEKQLIIKRDEEFKKTISGNEKIINTDKKENQMNFIDLINENVKKAEAYAKAVAEHALHTVEQGVTKEVAHVEHTVEKDVAKLEGAPAPAHVVAQTAPVVAPAAPVAPVVQPIVAPAAPVAH